MSRFLDISTEGQRGTAPLRGSDVDLFGLSSRQIAKLLIGHPGLEAMVESGDIKILDLIKMAPEAVAQCIAYGTGYEDDPAFGGDKAAFDNAVLRAHKLSGGEQVDMLMAIFDTSFGERLNPFVKGIMDRWTARAEGGSAEPLEPGKGKPPSLKLVSRDSLRQLRDALRSSTTPEQFGATPRANSPPLPDSLTSARAAS